MALLGLAFFHFWNVLTSWERLRVFLIVSAFFLFLKVWRIENWSKDLAISGVSWVIRSWVTCAHLYVEKCKWKCLIIWRNGHAKKHLWICILIYDVFPCIPYLLHTKRNWITIYIYTRLARKSGITSLLICLLAFVHCDCFLPLRSLLHFAYFPERKGFRRKSN